MKAETFLLRTRIARPASEVFAWHERAGALERLCPPWEHVEVLSASGGVRDGARVVVGQRIGPWRLAWQVEHRDHVAGRQFRDVQLSGPFAAWEHVHRFEPDGAGASFLTDEISYRLPGGRAGARVGGGFVRAQLAQLFAWRHARTQADLENAGRGSKPLTVLLAGASGLIGRELIPLLTTQGHHVRRLVRGPAQRPGDVFWNPAAGELSPAALEGVDAIINLSGENVAGGRWTERRREAIVRSRVDATRTLVTALRQVGRPPAVLLNASATGFYGDTGEREVSEEAGRGRGFLAGVCEAWENEADQAAALGVRVVKARFGVVLTPAGGALGKLLPVFRLGLGGRVGSGRQAMSWVSIDDVAAAMLHALTEPRCVGPMNVVAPVPVTNAEFTRTLGQVLNRPAVVPVPAAVLRLVFGRMADETLLGSVRALPVALTTADYVFRHPTLETALRHVLGRREFTAAAG